MESSKGVCYIWYKLLQRRRLHFCVYPSAKQLRAGIHTIAAKAGLPLRVHVEEIALRPVSQSKITHPATLLVRALCEAEGLWKTHLGRFQPGIWRTLGSASLLWE